MAVTNYNIKQVTNYDVSSYPATNHNIKLSNGEKQDIPYVEALADVKIIKMGYCCEPKGTELPIYIKTNDGKGYREIQIGETGMYEVQPEKWLDCNNPEMKEEEETTVVITGIMVPRDIIFTLDYVITIN